MTLILWLIEMCLVKRLLSRGNNILFIVMIEASISDVVLKD